MSEYIKIKRCFNTLVLFIFLSFSFILYDINFKVSDDQIKIDALSLIELPNLSLANDAQYLRLREFEDTYSSFSEAIGTISILKSSFVFKRRINE